MVNDLVIFNGVDAAVSAKSAAIDCGRFKDIGLVGKGVGAAVDVDVSFDEVSQLASPTTADADWAPISAGAFTVTAGSKASAVIPMCYKWARVVLTADGASVGTISIYAHVYVYNSGGMI